MGYRWFNVNVKHRDDGTVAVHYEGRGEFPFGKKVELEEGESITAHGMIKMDGQPSAVSWSFGDESSES